MKAIAHFYSVLFHPLFIPIYMMVVLFQLPSIHIQMLNPSFRFILVGLLLFNNVLLPIVSFLLLKKQGVIKSLNMQTADERRMPYLILFGLYSLTTLMLYRTSYIDSSIVFIPGAAALTILVLIPINRVMKISAHMASIGSAIAYLLLLHFYFQFTLIMPIIFAILAAGIIASSRLYLKAHTMNEIYAGFFVGLLISLLGGSLYLFT